MKNHIDMKKGDTILVDKKLVNVWSVDADGLPLVTWKTEKGNWVRPKPTFKCPIIGTLSFKKSPLAL